MGGVINPWEIDNLQLLLRLCLSVLLGGLIGFEREFNNHAAGFRTHILVSLGSCLIMTLSIYGFYDFVGELNVRIDPARLATAVITGVGFLGAGTILFTGKAITGLTTAASLWVVAAIGLAIGAGFYFAGIVTTALVIVVLWMFNKAEQWLFQGKKMRILTLYVEGVDGIANKVTKRLASRSIVMKKLSLNEKEGNDKALELKCHILTPKLLDPAILITDIKGIKGVSGIFVE